MSIKIMDFGGSKQHLRAEAFEFVYLDQNNVSL